MQLLSRYMLILALVTSTARASELDQCVSTLFGNSPLEGQIHRSTRVRDQGFLTHLLALVYVESRGDAQAKSTAGAHGLMQLTLGAVEDAVEYCDLPHLDLISSLLDPEINLRYGICYLRALHGEMRGDWTEILIVYNGGYRQLTRYRNGERIANETANYVLQVQRAVLRCTSMSSGTGGVSK